jgi:mannobiose 2-epimerase
MFNLTGEEKYYEVFEKTLRWIDTAQVDWEHGEWRAMIGPGPDSGKAGPWKAPYHNGRAVLECLEQLQRMR